ncbi:hypothetical protein GCM10020000_26520 [Streptomyces olivoverticillatus]
MDAPHRRHGRRRPRRRDRPGRDRRPRERSRARRHHRRRPARDLRHRCDLKGVDYDTWQRDVQAVVDRATPYVTERTAHADGHKQAIVLDIDNTSLETDFHWAAIPTPAVKPVLDLTRYAHSRGADIFFVTARPGILDSVTEWNLRKVGYPVGGLYVRHLPDLFEAVSTYKTAKRAEIEAKGYTIIANIGNNTTDLTGGHAERTFKLPDYDGKLS